LHSTVVDWGRSQVLKRFVVALGAVAIVGGLALPASAHVGIDPESVPKGSEAVTLAFNVPNEKDDATTNKVEIVLPENKPLSFVSAQPVAGWQLSIQKTKLATPLKNDEGEEVTEAVSRVIWSGGSIGAGQFQQFTMRVGPIPDDVGSLVFKALQTYSDGSTVRWIEPTPPGGAEPENPAPTLELTAATGDDHGGSTDTTSGSSEAASSSSSDDDSNGLAIVGIVVGAVALVVGAGAFVVARRPSKS
jgi:uncharacterized protein YcnI